MGFHPKETRITFLDVGQGDCASVETADGNHYLIDGGSSGEKNVGKYRILPFIKHQGIRTLDGIFVSHPDADHINGILEILEAVSSKKTSLIIKRLIIPGWPDEKTGMETLIEKAKAAECEILYWNRGQSLQSRHFGITSFHPDSQPYSQQSNQGSQVLLFTSGSLQVLFTGDLEGEGEQKMLEYWKEKAPEMKGKLLILKAAHHGSKNATSTAFLSEIKPQLAVISCAKKNSYGHPSPEVLKRLEERGCGVYLTEEGGAVTVRTDGKKTTIEKYRDKQYNRP